MSWGQQVAPKGLPVKPSAEGYDVSAPAGKWRIGATYMGRSFAASQQGSADNQKTVLHDSGDYIVVETAVYTPKDFTGDIQIGDFRLRIDGKKEAIQAVAPSLVAQALRTRDTDPMRRGVQYNGGLGNRDVMIGQPRQQPRFPGDPTPGQRPPGTTTVREGELENWDAAVESGLPEGPLQSARAGNLFFPFKGKMTKVKTIVLEYEGVAGRMELKLR